MIKIAVCDDDDNVCKCIYQYLFDAEDIINEEIKADIFADSCELKSNYFADSYDLLFIDIEMPFISGIELTEYIRNDVNDINLNIVFISSHTSYALELFKIMPMDFLIKPIKSDDVLRILKQWQRINAADNSIFTIQNRNKIYRIKIEDIIYVESRQRKIFIHCRDFIIDNYGKLSDITNKKIFDFFIEIHKSFFINYNHIVSITNNSVKLTNGDILPISQSKRFAAFKKFMELGART